MATILQMAFSYTIFCMKIEVFRYKFHCDSPQGLNEQESSIGLDNDEGPSMRKAIISADVGFVYWSTYV